MVCSRRQGLTRRREPRAWLASLLVFVATWMLASMAPAAAEKRLALVIGNDTYRNVPVLQKARADAQSVGAALKALGFAVTVEVDADFSTFNTALSNLSERIEPGDTALFFFAGHGFAIDGRNYLLPTDIPAAKAGQADLVRRAAMATDEITSSLRAKGAKTVVAVLDACRDNPFAASGTRSLAGGRGLARPITENGEFILMSAGTAQTALDRLDDEDASRNSVFTRVFLQAMAQPGQDLVGIARTTRIKVAELAASRSHAQTPSYYDDGAGAFIFVPAGSQVTITLPDLPRTEAAGTGRVSNAAQEEVFWQSADRGGTRPEIDAYLARVKSGEFKGTFEVFANARIARLDAEERAASEKLRRDERRRAEDAARQDRVRVADLSGPTKIYTEGMNGSTFVRGSFVRTAPGEWVEENTQTGRSKLFFRTVDQTPTLITVLDPSRNLYLQFDLQGKQTRLRSGPEGNWLNFYAITRIAR